MTKGERLYAYFLYVVLIIFIGISLNIIVSKIDNRDPILEENQSYIAIKYQHLDNETEVVNEVIELLEKGNLDISEILMIKDRKIDSRIRLGEVEK